MYCSSLVAPKEKGQTNLEAMLEQWYRTPNAQCLRDWRGPSPVGTIQVLLCTLSPSKLMEFCKYIYIVKYSTKYTTFKRKHTKTLQSILLQLHFYKWRHIICQAKHCFGLWLINIPLSRRNYTYKIYVTDGEWVQAC